MQQTTTEQTIPFESIKAKYGYEDLKKLGFFGYKSDGWGDWHRSNKIPRIRICGNYKGYEVYKKNDKSLYGSCKGYSIFPLEFNTQKIPPQDIEALKKRIIEALKQEVSQ